MMYIVRNCYHHPYSKTSAPNGFRIITFCTRYEEVADDSVYDRCIATGPDMVIVLDNLNYWKAD